jgi:hypothetical protein
MQPTKLSDEIHFKIYAPRSDRNMRVMTMNFTPAVSLCCGREFSYIDLPRKAAADVIRSWRKGGKVNKEMHVEPGL